MLFLDRLKNIELIETVKNKKKVVFLHLIHTHERKCDNQRCVHY